MKRLNGACARRRICLFGSLKRMCYERIIGRTDDFLKIWWIWPLEPVAISPKSVLTKICTPKSVLTNHWKSTLLWAWLLGNGFWSLQATSQSLLMLFQSREKKPKRLKKIVCFTSFFLHWINIEKLLECYHEKELF